MNGTDWFIIFVGWLLLIGKIEGLKDEIKKLRKFRKSPSSGREK